MLPNSKGLSQHHLVSAQSEIPTHSYEEHFSKHLPPPPFPLHPLSRPYYSHVWDTRSCNVLEVLPQQLEPFRRFHYLLQLANPLHHRLVTLCNGLLQTVNRREDKPIQDSHQGAVVVHSV